MQRIPRPDGRRGELSRAAIAVGVVCVCVSGGALAWWADQPSSEARAPRRDLGLSALADDGTAFEEREELPPETLPVSGVDRLPANDGLGEAAALGNELQAMATDAGTREPAAPAEPPAAETPRPTSDAGVARRPEAEEPVATAVACGATTCA